MRKRRRFGKPKFKIGQVVAMGKFQSSPRFFRIGSWHYDRDGEIRYMFDSGRSENEKWKPLERILRPLTNAEAGRKGQ